MTCTVSDRRYVVEKSKIVHNIQVLRRQTGNRKIYAVLKADGYGLGCRELAYLCEGAGLRCFAVNDLEEAEAVAGAGIEVEELLYMRSALPEQIPRLAELGITFTVASAEDAQNLAGLGVRAHIKVDTGMGRRGLPAEDASAILDLYSRFPDISYTGIYTHFADGTNAPKTKKQFAGFQAVLSALERAGIDPGTRHCCNSAAVFYQSGMLLDGVRVGSAILGRLRAGDRFGLEKTGTCQVRVEAVRNLHKGAAVGYGGLFRAHRDMTVAVCPIGTHHGVGVAGRSGVQTTRETAFQILRLLRDRLTGCGVLTASVCGINCKVLGRVCSEAVMLDVTDIPCQTGDTALFDVNPMLLHDVPVEFV